VAILIGTVVLTVYVMVSGIHGSAWTAVLKDVTILVVAVFLGIYLPIHYYGGIGSMFSAVQAAKPGFVALPTAGLSPSWFISTVLLTSFGFYMWPQFFGATFSAQNERVFRRNAIVLPIYQLILLFIFFVGFAAILQVPGLKGAAGDLSLLRLVKEAFPPWLVGIVGAAGVLTAMVPGSMLLMTSATVLANNVFPVFQPAATQRQIGTLARAIVPVIAVIALLFTFRGGSAIVSLLLAGYSLVTQLFPALIASLPRRPVVPKEAAATGIIAGVLTVAYLTVSGTTVATLLPALPQWIKDLNVGIVALLVNLAALAVVTFVMRALSGAGAGTSPAPVRIRQPAEAGDTGRS
jgi:SSS family solute:Na+ symporter